MDGGTQITPKSKSHSQWLQLTNVAVAGVGVALGFEAGQYYQVLSLFVFLVPVPIAFLTLHYATMWAGISTIGISVLVISLLSGYRMGVLFLLLAGIAAIIFAIGFLKNVSATVMITCVTCYYVLLGIAFISLQHGVTFETYAQAVMTVFKTQFAQLYATKGVEWQELESQFTALARVLSIISPLLSALSSSLIMYLLSRVLLKVWKTPVTSLGRFQDWEASEYLVWVFVLGGVLYHLELTRVIGINIILGLILLYYLQGCAIITFFLKRKQTARVMQFFAYGLLFLQIPYIFASLGLLLTGYTQDGIFLSLPAIILVAGIGLANVWVGFRQRVEQQGEK